MWEIFPKVLEGLAVATDREQVAAFFRGHPYVSTLIIVAILLGLGFALFNGVIEFGHKIKEWSQSRRGRFALMLSFATAAVAACFVVYAVPAMLEPTPEFTAVKPEVVGGPLAISWKYKAPQHLNRSNKAIYYELQYAEDRAFSVGVAKQTIDSPFGYFRQPPAGRHFWRVRPVIQNGKNFEPLSNWSPPIEITYYNHSIDRIRDTGVINIFTSRSNYQGFFKFIKNGKFGGFDIDLITSITNNITNLMGLKFGLKPNIVAVPWIQLLDTPDQGRADIIISTITKRKQREFDHNIKFSDVYYCTTQSVLYRNATNFVSVRDAVKSPRLGVEKGTTSEKIVQKLRADYKINANLEYFPEVQDLIAAVEEGKIDFAITDTPFAVGARLRPRDPTSALRYHEFKPADFPPDFPDEMKAEKYAIAVRKGDEKLLGFINQSLEQMKDNGHLAQLMQSAMMQFANNTGDASVTGDVPTHKVSFAPTPWLCPNKPSSRSQ